MIIDTSKIRNESDLRKWLERQAHGNLYCIENKGKGGTLGFPDTLIPVGSVLVPFELKMAKYDMKTGHWRINLRAQQKQVMRRFESEKVQAWVLAAMTGGVDKRMCHAWVAHNYSGGIPDEEWLPVYSLADMIKYYHAAVQVQMEKHSIQ